MAKALVLSIAAAVAFIMPAHADWQFTKWGMKPDQVKALSQGNAVALDGAESSRNSLPNDIAKLSMPFDSGQLHFRALFYFDANDHLDRVRLHTEDSNAPALRQALREKYGDPIAGEKPYDSVLDWMTAADHVRFFSIGLTTVEYSPRASADAKGL